MHARTKQTDMHINASAHCVIVVFVRIRQCLFVIANVFRSSAERFITINLQFDPVAYSLIVPSNDLRTVESVWPNFKPDERAVFGISLPSLEI